ncbi:sulfite exporter TauE/SafE family protein [Bordetella bronchiseptica]|uniref:sulfite exporter TauE/SafE family protein n=1 Tax=Bordetella bronchiseptica TaxID=518 RepID=UPI00045BA5C6|nr:sulfite exporter TauE/SafE family protein [Bordetella bronchiseptica]KAK51791.1 sulfite exporter TauE/SafE [Bordetella bronchiseptica OSU054]KDB74768.1 sulfite exporter TauE/SafE [Bordetella bronchiseptica CA90 BB1334]KDD46846.1 sulfite exporter TauE/SafE [Bordetella bronchiseptica OSU095]
MPWLAYAPDPWLFAAMAATVFVAAVAQGIGGVGFAMLAAPVAGIFFPQLAPGPLLTLGGFVSLLTALRERAAIDWATVGYTLVGRFAGTLVAIYALTRFAPQLLSVLFAVSILAAVGISVAGVRISASPAQMSGAGLASGVMGTITSVGAPPLAIMMQHSPPPRLRATLGLILFIGASFSLTMLSLADRYGVNEFLLSVGLLPFLLLGFSCSSRLKERMRPATVRRILLGICAIGALVVLARAALGA